MLLKSIDFSKCRRTSIQGVKLAILALLQATSACAAEPRLPCFLEMAVYDPRGTRLQFKITVVTPVEGEGDRRINLLTDERTKDHLSVTGDGLFFAESLIRRSLEITLSDGKGATIQKDITLWGCQQRWSIQHGSLDTGGDAAWSLVSGQVSGCPVTGDWWIRAIPMFGNGTLSYEGYISPGKGSFQMAVGSVGGRYILVIGKDRSPLKVVGIDVVGAGVNEVGTVDLSGSCPK